MKLWVLEYYSNKGYSLEKGQVIEVDENTARWLLADAPGCFSLWEPEQKAPAKPKEDKMLGSPMRSKDWQNITVPELRKLLKERGLPTDGKKADLIERLANA